MHAGSGPSTSEGSLAASQQDKLWVVDTLPTQWTVPVQTAAGLGRMLEKRSTCELEADACVEHVLNRADVSPSTFGGSKALDFCARASMLALVKCLSLDMATQSRGKVLQLPLGCIQHMHCKLEQASSNKGPLQFMQYLM